MMDLQFAQCSDRGRVRDHNEDYLGYVQPETPEHARTHGWLFALADGVGGQPQGDVASRIGVESLLAGFRQAAAGELHAALLTRLVQAANHRIHEAGLAAGRSGAGMATTIVACALRYDRAAVAHVGDSRCYLIRRGHAISLTRDHTLVNEQVRLGLLSGERAPESAIRHVLSRALGVELFVGVEVGEHQVFADDVLLLCSDGLHNAATAPEIARVISASASLELAAQELVRIANQRDGSDNISVQLIRVRSVERVGMYRGRPYKLH
ncbi:MAG: PP2C family protein-serine/threonine phosphatase [Terriglobia bacterium]